MISYNPDYDPKNEGFRRVSGSQERRDLVPVSQNSMFELAYYLYDTSGIVKRFVRDTTNFIIGKGITWQVTPDDDGRANEIIQEFWDDPINQVSIRLPIRLEFLFLLGEQCWPVNVDPISGRVRWGYIDPVNVEDVLTIQNFPEIISGVKLISSAREGKAMTAIMPEMDMQKPNYGRRVGECFFFSINHPPNSPRGRSDLIHLFDFINGFEEGIFDELDRTKLIKSYIWDVLLEGATDKDIQKFLENTRTPKAGSIRAHNERVQWQAVSPDLKAHDSKSLFDMLKDYMSACQNRPSSWLGSGGKAYQTEADLMGEPTFMDLESRQSYVKYVLESVLSFVLDQAIIHGVWKPKDGKYKVTVNLPEMRKKDMKSAVETLNTAAGALTLAQNNKWITKETAGKLFASLVSETGFDIDVENEQVSLKNEESEFYKQPDLEERE